MRASTAILVLGAALFALPIPGTFMLGGLVIAAGLGTRWYGS